MSWMTQGSKIPHYLCNNMAFNHDIDERWVPRSQQDLSLRSLGETRRDAWCQNTWDWRNTSASKISNENQSIHSFAKSGSANNKVIKAKCMMANFIVEHNLPLVMSDDLSKLLPQMFLDCQIVKAFSCKITKTMQFVHRVAKHHQGELVDLLKKQQFTIMTDGSSDHGVQTQLYPIMLRPYSETSGKIVTQLLVMPQCLSWCTGENVFSLLNDTLKAQGISWNYCVAYRSDNAAVLMGSESGVCSFVKKVNDKVFVSGCMCHLINLAVSKAVSAIPLDITELLEDIFYYLDKSAKRKPSLRAVQELYNAEGNAILKYCAICWLFL